MHLLRRWLPTLAGITALHPIPGQLPASPAHTLRGVVTSVQGTGIAGANVFLLETLDGVVSDADGRFVVRTAADGHVTLVARHVGFAPANIVVPVDTAGQLTLVLRPQAAA